MELNITIFDAITITESCEFEMFSYVSVAEDLNLSAVAVYETMKFSPGGKSPGEASYR